MSLLQIYFIIICLGLNLIKNINGHLHPAYNHDTNGLGSNPDWQSKLDDNIKINHLSLPGTHDTMADDNDNDSVDTQDSSLPKQLEAGIRVLDIRARAYNGEFPIHHGAFYLNAKFDDVLNECKEFLDAHPREFIIMNVQQEYSEVSADDFGKIFATYFNNKKWSSYFYRSDDYDIIPSVGDVRGKIYILQYWGYEQKIEKFGFNMGANDINNDYWLDTNWDLYEKWEGIKSYLIKANDNPKPSKFIINYLSANGGSWPYFVASGHSSIGTGAPRLSTGLTTPGWSDSYPDFPRVDCFIGICTIAFEGTNILTYEYIKNNALTFVGIIYADFPGQGLIDLIIPLNYINYRITSNEGYWGTWSLPRYCKPGEFANAFSLKVEGPQGEDGDDTAANSFRMKCSDGEELIANNEGEWGGWSGYQTCSGGQHFKGFRTFVEPAQGDGDDTALNSLQIQCGDQQILSASNGGIWGNWGSWGLCANDDRVCGFQQKVEPAQGGGDDTSLNGIRLWCCRQITEQSLAIEVSWTQVNGLSNGALKQISIGSDSTIVGVDHGDRIWKYNETSSSWSLISETARLKQISVGNTAIWGVNSDDDIWSYTNNNQWTHIAGKLKHVSVGSDGTVWGVNDYDQIYRYGDNTWTQMTGGLSQISVGSQDHIIGVNSLGKIWKLSVPSSQAPSTNTPWILVENPNNIIFKYVNISKEGDIFAIDTNDRIYHYKSGWMLISGNARLKQMESNNGIIIGVNSANEIWKGTYS